MKFNRCEADALRRLADMPFLDRLELAALTGWSKGAVYDAVAGLEREGMVESVPHASPLVSPTRRHALTAAGVDRLTELDAVPLEKTLFLLPVSRQWRRGLLERLDGVAVIYRLACAVNQVFHPVVFRWYRAMPLDAALVLPDGRTLTVVRQGSTADRTAFGKRLWRLGQLPPTSAVLLLLPDEVRLARPAEWRRHCPGRCSWPWRATPLPPERGPPSGARPPVPRPWTYKPPWPTPGRPEHGPCANRRNGPPCPMTWTPGPIACCRPCSSQWRSGPWTCWPTGPGCRPNTWAHCLA